MTTQELLTIVQERGMRVLLKDGRPVLQFDAANKKANTDALLSVLKFHRQPIIDLLSKQSKENANA